MVPAKSVRRMTITGIMPAMTQFIDNHSAATVEVTARP